MGQDTMENIFSKQIFRVFLFVSPPLRILPNIPPDCVELDLVANYVVIKPALPCEIVKAILVCSIFLRSPYSGL